MHQESVLVNKETSLAALVACVLCAVSAAACSSTPAGDGSPSARRDAAGGGDRDGAATDAPGGQGDGGQRDSSVADSIASGPDGTNTAGDAAPETGANDATGASDASPAVDGGSPGAVFDDALRLRAQAAMVPLAAWYDTPTGLWNKTDWWTSANQLETVIDYSRETGDPTYAWEIDNTFVTNSAGNFDHFGYYDDDGWWAMAWIKAYDLSHQQKYLDMAKTIFTRMSGAWDGKCGGGIYWAGTKAGANAFQNKNAIPNELFLQVAASLHLRTPGDAGAGSYLEWAQREWTWFKSTGMLTAKNQIVDGLADLTTCAATGPIFTYNQGVLVGGLVDLAAGTGDMSLLDQASAIARATITLMADPKGILLEAPCGGDICVQFKGVFMRNLAHVYRARPLPEFQAYMRHQSDNLWNSNRNPQNQFGYEWQLPFDKATASRQSSALDALMAAVMSSNLNLALTGTATGSAACSGTETADRAIDGSSGWNSKWCSPGPGGQTLTVDLGSPRAVVAFRLRHAGAGGESGTLNTRDFEIEISGDGQTWARPVTVTGNTTDVTTHPIPAVMARYARLNVTNPQTATTPLAARIYEFEIFGIGL